MQDIKAQQGLFPRFHEPFLVRGCDEGGAGLLTGSCPLRKAAFVGAHCLVALVQSQEHCLGKIQGRGLSRGGDGHDVLAKLYVLVFQAPVLGTEH